MHCPLYIDFTRECIKEVEIMPNNTLLYCTTDKYKDCPFYKIIKKEKGVCENIKKCHAFPHLQLSGFEPFVEVSERFCTSPSHKKCQRYILKKSGEEVPEDLHPDGTIMNNEASI